MDEGKKIEDIERKLDRALDEIDALKKEVAALKTGDPKKEQIVAAKETVEAPSKKDHAWTDRFKKTRETTDVPREKDYETIIGQVWLPRIFIFVLIIGVLWAFNLAIDEGWLTEGMRVACGFVAGIGLFFIAGRQIAKERFALGKALYVGSIGVWVFTTFAMAFLYGMIPNYVGVAIGLVWIAIGIWKAIQLKSQVMGIMFSLVGQLLPFIMGGKPSEMSLMLLVAYEFIFYIAIFYIAMLQQYKILKWFSSIAFVITNICIFFISGTIEAFTATSYERVLTVLAIVAVLQHIVIFYDVYKRSAFQEKLSISLLITSFFNAVIWSFLETLNHAYYYKNLTLFTGILCAYIIGYGFLAWRAHKRADMHQFSAALIIVVLAFTINVYQLSMGIYAEQMKVALFILQSAALIYIGYKYALLVQRIIGSFIFLGTTIFMIVVYAFPVKLFEQVPTLDSYVKVGWVSVVLWLLWLAVTVALAEIVGRYSKRAKKWDLKVCLIIVASFIFLMKLGPFYEIFNYATVLWILIIAGLLYMYMNAKEMNLPKIKRAFAGYNIVLHLLFIAFFMQSLDVTYDVQMMGITFGWLLYAIAAIVLGFKLAKKSFRMVGLILVFVSLAKLFLFDFTALDLTIRVILFIIVGVAGMFVSRLFYKK